MRCFTTELKEHFPALADMPRGILKCYIPEDNPELVPQTLRPSILIFPGGAYKYTSEREAEPIALSYLGKGFNAFVLYYAVEPAKYPCALVQAMASVALIRNKGKEWLCNGQVCVMGFSAGGHLAACASNPDPSLVAKYGFGDVRPNAAVLAYAVISSSPEHTHGGSFEALCNNKEEWDALSAEKLVSDKTPPTFLWMTSEDPLVPVTNCFVYATELYRHGVKFEMHIFPNGCHGLACCNVTTAGVHDFFYSQYCERWIDMSFQWFKEIKMI